MSKEQIEEMARELIIVKDKDGQINFPKTAEHLYIRGFRMQSEGEWVDQYQGMYVNQLYKCSLCGETAFHDDKRWFLTHHCPRCGAKMKGV